MNYQSEAYSNRLGFYCSRNGNRFCYSSNGAYSKILWIESKKKQLYPYLASHKNDYRWKSKTSKATESVFFGFERKSWKGSRHKKKLDEITIACGSQVARNPNITQNWMFFLEANEHNDQYTEYHTKRTADKQNNNNKC